MDRKREKVLASLFRKYKANKKELAQGGKIPEPSGVSYDKIRVKGDLSKNVPYEMTVEYISRREELFKEVFIVEEVLNWFKLEGHGRDRFIQLYFIGGCSWTKAEIVCNISHSTLSIWRREVLEKSEIIAKWVNFF